MPASFVKDTQAVLDYQWDWSAWLPAGDTILTHTITAAAGLTVASSANTTTAVTAWLTMARPGVTYAVACKIVTAQNRTDERSIDVRGKER